MRYYRPVDIARELDISTSALRHYEAWGVVPKPERAANGFRRYTEVHLAYFRCLRAMSAGFGTAVTYEVLEHVQKGKMDAAFWLVNRELADLHHEKSVADQTLALLREPDLPIPNLNILKGLSTIGEVAELAKVRPSAIRHWGNEGLLFPERDPENGYRLFTTTHIRQILLIRTLRKTVYFLENMKEIVQAVENRSVEEAMEVAENALDSIHQRNRQQLHAVYQLVELCKEIGLWES